jgi:hypothetical protein
VEPREKIHPIKSDGWDLLPIKKRCIGDPIEVISLLTEDEDDGNQKVSIASETVEKPSTEVA